MDNMKILSENIDKIDLGNIIFDKKKKEFEILKGSVGVYKYQDVIGSQIIFEHARYKGRSPMFSHRILISTFNNSIFIEIKKVYVGIEIKLLNGEKKYVYISNEPVIQHNFQFKEDMKVATVIKKKMSKIAELNKKVERKST